MGRVMDTMSPELHFVLEVVCDTFSESPRDFGGSELLTYVPQQLPVRQGGRGRESAGPVTTGSFLSLHS